MSASYRLARSHGKPDALLPVLDVPADRGFSFPLSLVLSFSFSFFLYDRRLGRGLRLPKGGNIDQYTGKHIVNRRDAYQLSLLV